MSQRSYLWEDLYMAAGFLASMLDNFDAWDFASFYHGVLSPALSFLLLNNTGVSSCIECVPHAEVTVNSLYGLADECSLC